MIHRLLTPQELRSAEFPIDDKPGYEIEKVDAAIELCAQTIEHLEDQIAELQRSVALARAESAPMEINESDEEDAIAQWLTTIDPLDISQEVQKNIAQTLVESTMAASHIRHEAKERAKSLIDAVADEVSKLVVIVKESRNSVESALKLQENIAMWEGGFSGRISLLLEQLQLPWTVQVSQLAKVLAHMAEKERTTIVEPEHAPSHVSQRKHIDPPAQSVTTSGDWS